VSDDPDDREREALLERLAELRDEVDRVEVQMVPLRAEIDRLQAAYEEAKDDDSFLDDATGSVFGSDEEEILDQLMQAQREYQRLDGRQRELLTEQREIVDELEEIEQEEIREQLTPELRDVDDLTEAADVEVAALVIDDAIGAPTDVETELDRDLPFGAGATGGAAVDADPVLVAVAPELDVPDLDVDVAFGAGAGASAVSADLPIALATGPVEDAADVADVAAPVGLDELDVDLTSVAFVDAGELDQVSLAVDDAASAAAGDDEDP
jgi:hypothetical protein